MHIVCVTTTYNRDRCLQRILRSYLEQNYTGRSTLLVFNSGRPTSFPELDLPPNKEIILINRTISNITGEEFTSIGEKYTEAVSCIQEGDIFTSMDADDIFFRNHLSEGVKGMERAYTHNRLAYKPKKSFFKSSQGVLRNENVYEPSMFVDLNHIRATGFLNTSVSYHDGWLLPLIESNKLLVDPSGVSTFCYDWGGIPVYKMSGRGDDSQENFDLSQAIERDYGNGLTKPISTEDYYNLCSDILTNYKEI